jgi:hypothetical protein
MGLLEKYKLLHEAATSPRSADCGARSVYRFKKHCKNPRCGAGLTQPKRNASRISRSLFRRSFCSEDCLEGRTRHKSLFPRSLKAGHSNAALRTYPAEKSSFAALQLIRSMRGMTRLQKMVVVAETSFNLSSEKLSYMEHRTGQKWSASRFFYHLGRASV